MSRVDRHEIVLDTSHFTPDQLQTRFVLQTCMNGWARWARANLAPFNELIRDWHFGLVVVRAHVQWLRPFTFFDSDVVEVTSACTVRPNRRLMHGEVEFSAGGHEVVLIELGMVPIRITDESLTAEPAPVSDEVFARFREDEVRSAPGRQRVTVRAKALRADGHHLGHATHEFRICRSDIEVADQWSFIEVPNHTAGARENMILSGTHAALDGALARPVRSIQMEITRPLYIFDEARVETDAYLVEDAPVFVHEIASAGSGGGMHALVVEELGTRAATLPT
jgi:acyl-CoA thioesterase FadM